MERLTVGERRRLGNTENERNVETRTKDIHTERDQRVEKENQRPTWGKRETPTY